MNRFFSAVCLCGFLMLLGLFFFSPGSQAGNNILADMLNLPAPPPPNPLTGNSRLNRPEDFYDKSKPPPDDAPLQDLLDYWQTQNDNYRRLGYNVKPSEKALRRILKACEEKPEKFADFLNVFPPDEEIAERLKYFYDNDLSEDKLGEDWQRMVKSWLTYNSKYYVDKLLKKARTVRDDNGYVNNQEELLALAVVDWDTARPLLDTLLANSNQPVSNTLAKWAFYRHALDTGDQGDIERYRDLLKEVVEDKDASPGMRDLAFDALVKEKDWEGRDEWYLKLLEDETLLDLKVRGQTYTGLTTIIIYSPPQKYVDKMLELLKSDNPAVRNAVVRNLSTLLTADNPEVVRALLPWLQDPKWAKEVGDERRQLVNALKTVTIPESVPGLLAALNEKNVREAADPNNRPEAANAAARPVNSAMNAVNATMYAANMAMTRDYAREEPYPLRDEAVDALGAQKDARAAPALRAILPAVNSYKRNDVVGAILNCHGFSMLEQVAALETIARNSDEMSNLLGQGTNAANVPVGNPYGGRMILANTMPGVYNFHNEVFSPAQIPFLLGFQLIRETEPSNELVVAVLDRIDLLEKKEPRIAAALRQLMQRWRGAAMNSLALREVKKGTASLEFVIRLLSQRKELKEKQFNEVYDIRGGNPLAHGIAACLLEDDNEYNAILAGQNAESKAAMLGCARLIRANLPLQKVAENLKSPDKMLALAAERYLESEDSPAARQIILAHYPNTARILGARVAFEPEGVQVALNNEDLWSLFRSVNGFFEQGMSSLGVSTEDLGQKEKKLKKELDEDKDLLGVYSYDDNFIRVYADKAVFSWEEDVSRYRERTLKKEEFDNFRNYLIRENVDEFPPFLSYCDYCDSSEFLMFGRAGGRRVFFHGDEVPKFEQDLADMFEEMRKPPAKLHYWLEKHVPGLEILFEDNSLQARTLWKNGDDFRLLIEDEPRRKKADEELRYPDEDEAENEPADPEKIRETWAERRQKAALEGFFWYRYAGNKLAGVIAQPPGIEYAPENGEFFTLPEARWRGRTANFEIRGDYEGLYKIIGGRTTKIKEGEYQSPLATPNGRWAIVSKTVDYRPQLFRVNLLTGKEFPIKMPDHMFNEAVAFLPSLNKVLLFGGNFGDYDQIEDYDNEETLNRNMKGDNYLLDPDSGLLVAVKGEIRPLRQQTFRQLQPAGVPETFWAAIPDPEKTLTQFGVYDARTLSFKSLLTIPQIEFDSMSAWVDEKEGKLYFVYEGQLLSLPLPKPPVR
jgi:HEAT repeat protein